MILMFKRDKNVSHIIEYAAVLHFNFLQKKAFFYVYVYVVPIKKILNYAALTIVLKQKFFSLCSLG